MKVKKWNNQCSWSKYESKLLRVQQDGLPDSCQLAWQLRKSEMECEYCVGSNKITIFAKRLYKKPKSTFNWKWQQNYKNTEEIIFSFSNFSENVRDISAKQEKLKSQNIPKDKFQRWSKKNFRLRFIFWPEIFFSASLGITLAMIILTGCAWTTSDEGME